MKIPDEKQDALLKRAVRGDEQAFLALYQKHQPALYRYALRMTGSPWAAEEIVQEVFLLLIREPQKYEAARGGLGAFLFGVARNRGMKHLERTPRELSLDVINADGSAWREPQDPLTPMMIAEKRERIEQVREAVLELSAEFREAVGVAWLWWLLAGVCGASGFMIVWVLVDLDLINFTCCNFNS